STATPSTSRRWPRLHGSCARWFDGASCRGRAGGARAGETRRRNPPRSPRAVFAEEQADDLQRGVCLIRGACAAGGDAPIPDGQGAAEILLSRFAEQLVAQLASSQGPNLLEA